jgi:hypothetical protein
VIVGVNRAEALVDADQFDRGRGFAGLNGHALSPTFSSATQPVLRDAPLARRSSA